MNEPATLAQSTLDDRGPAADGLGQAAFVVALVGFVLCVPALAVSIVAVALPARDTVTSYWGMAMVACGAIGLWPAVAGLALGVADLVALRKRGPSNSRRARWAVVLGLGGPLLMAVGFLALWLNAQMV